ncbi:MAG: hypothetical protein RMK16_10655 [Acidobacteriota bacterium]|nr:hypothetical protein [Acidobacteriota bacterium]
MVILYNPPSTPQWKPVLPLSLLALGAVLEGVHEYIIVDGNLEADPLTTLDRAVRETGADVPGVTVMPGPQLADAVPVSRQLKARYAHLTVVWGDYFPDPALRRVPPGRLRGLCRAGSRGARLPGSRQGPQAG